MLELIQQPWPWWVAGPLIALTMFLLMYFGKSFGISANLRTACAMGGAGKFSDFFRFEWKNEIWNLVFILGALVGGFIAANYLTPEYQIALSEATVGELEALGFQNPGATFVPSEIFSLENFLSLKGFLVVIVGGFLVGFGARYAGGCTSGHAISGLSALEWPSLVAVIGFFIGGLFTTYVILPYLLTL